VKKQDRFNNFNNANECNNFVGIAVNDKN